MALDKQDLTAIKGIVDDSIDTKVQPMIADLKQFVSDGFDGMHELVNNVEKNLTDEIQEVKAVVKNSVVLLNNHEVRITKLEEKLR